MKLNGRSIELSTGTKIYNYAGIFGIVPASLEMHGGNHDPMITAGLTQAERAEIADFAIKLWTRFKVQKVAMAWYYDPDGAATDILPENKEYFTDQEIIDWVGGEYGIETLMSGELIIFNLLPNQQYNDVPSAIYGREIYGPIIICHKDLIE